MTDNLSEFSSVEKSFFCKPCATGSPNKIKYIVTESFPELGLVTALRFLEWVSLNPDGVVSLPTGKTPEYFIKWTRFFLENWESRKAEDLKERCNFPFRKKPELNNLRFVQIDEFYPISSAQHNSFYHYVNRFYVKELGIDPAKALFINSDSIPLPDNLHFSEVFPDSFVDLSLRNRQCRGGKERLMQKSIFMIDRWCMEYEERIRDMGGIGFFLGGIGPDGHIAFNIRGSSHYSVTRLDATNFETQAVSASDLGGIESARNRSVITIGLETITCNKDAVAVIMAAGTAKAGIVRKSIESVSSNTYPATALSKLNGSCFYLTRSAASELDESINSYYDRENWDDEKTERAVLELCRKKNVFASRITLSDLKNDRYTGRIPSPDTDAVERVRESVISKLSRGLKEEEGAVFLHTAPHHDDIMLGILPYVNKQLASVSNSSHFAILTSGFTSVTNSYLKSVLEKTLSLIEQGRIEMISYSNFFETGYRLKQDKDIYSYLNSLASGSESRMMRSLCHRIVRGFVEIYSAAAREELSESIRKVIGIISSSYDGEKDPPDIQKLKGMIREFEEELVWAHSGVQVENIHHMRLGFYQGDIFTENPEVSRDVEPFIALLKKIKPSVITLVMDPEGSGPDTHYKVLQVIAQALRITGRENDLSDLRIIGYRNIWYRYLPSEANIIFPVTLNSLSLLKDSFAKCYRSQVNASFPSYLYDGPFSELAQKIWVDQLKDIHLLLGKDYFYLSDDPKIRSTHGLIYMREMNVDDFLKEARALEESAEGIPPGPL